MLITLLIALAFFSLLGIYGMFMSAMKYPKRIWEDLKYNGYAILGVGMYLVIGILTIRYK